MLFIMNEGLITDVVADKADSAPPVNWKRRIYIGLAASFLSIGVSPSLTNPLGRLGSQSRSENTPEIHTSDDFGPLECLYTAGSGDSPWSIAQKLRNRTNIRTGTLSGLVELIKPQVKGDFIDPDEKVALPAEYCPPTSETD